MSDMFQNFGKNLISLGALDSMGYMYIEKGGAMKINKGALVIMKGPKARKWEICTN